MSCQVNGADLNSKVSPCSSVSQSEESSFKGCEDEKKAMHYIVDDVLYFICLLFILNSGPSTCSIYLMGVQHAASPPPTSTPFALPSWLVGHRSCTAWPGWSSAESAVDSPGSTGEPGPAGRCTQTLSAAAYAHTQRGDTQVNMIKTVVWMVLQPVGNNHLTAAVRHILSTVMEHFIFSPAKQVSLQMHMKFSG